MRTVYLAFSLVGLTLPALHGPLQAAACGAAPAVAPAAHPAESPAGIQWQPSLVAAKASAARTGKPLFLLHLFGKLDEAFC